MPRKVREIREGPEPPEGEEDTRPVTIVQQWTRKEQIVNAIENVAPEDAGSNLPERLAVDEIAPPLTTAEKRQYAKEIAKAKEEAGL